MTKVISGRIEKGKIVPAGILPSGMNNVQIKIFIFPQNKSRVSYFGRGKGIFGDGLKFQKKARREWK